MQREIEKGRDGEGGREGRETERVSVWPYMVNKTGTTPQYQHVPKTSLDITA